MPIRINEAGLAEIHAFLAAHLKRGETRARDTISKTGDEGNGAPPACMTDDWARVASCANGEVRRGSER